MGKTRLASRTFGVVYYTECGAALRTVTIEATGYWEACEAAWGEVHKSRDKKNMADFQIVEDQAAIAAGPQHIRAAAVVKTLVAREASRKAAA